MGGKNKEACGRCSMSTVVDVAGGVNDEAGDGDEKRRSPFDGARIEVDEGELRAVALPAVWLGAVKRRLDEVATRLTYGR